MTEDEIREWVRFIATVERHQNAGDDNTKRAVRREFPLHFALLSFWLNQYGVTGGVQTCAYDPPDDCDLCGVSLSKNGLFIDGQIHDGRWSFMCLGCYAGQGTGIGWGIGQLYRLVGKDGNGMANWICIAGGPPNAEAAGPR
jgi:hypothetical protein